jgi:hypothetical protein
MWANDLCTKHLKRVQRTSTPYHPRDSLPTSEESVIKVLRDGPVLDWHDPDFHEPDPEFTWEALKAAWDKHRDTLPQDCWAARHFEKSA